MRAAHNAADHREQQADSDQDTPLAEIQEKTGLGERSCLQRVDDSARCEHAHVETLDALEHVGAAARQLGCVLGAHFCTYVLS